MKNNENFGQVILAGAGPGDPDLITIKALRALQAAEVVIADRLVSQELLSAHCAEEALVLHVGKQAGMGGSTPQGTINELMVYYALQGKKVIRLKGGDLCIFSHLLEELEVLRQQGIPFEIIPGVTAASGAAAACGIPLTARGHADAVRFLTFHPGQDFGGTRWQELASTSDTLAFYMSAGTVMDLVTALIQHGARREKWIALIEQATTPMQEVRRCPLSEYGQRWGDRKPSSPSLIIIGSLAGLAQPVSWSQEKGGGESYFKSVERRARREERA
jgi:uroporphyrin-III C-methyltransferase